MMVWRQVANSWRSLLLVAVLLGQAANATEQGECYDLKIEALIIEQIPTLPPRPDEPNTIIMSWPWFLDLRIGKVLEGTEVTEVITVLSVQHTYMVPRPRVWWLRRNDAGLYNVIWADDPESDDPPACPDDALPARSYLVSGPGNTLEQSREDGLERYGSYADRRRND